MFEFLFKRATDKPSDPQTAVAASEQTDAAAESASRRDEQAERARALAGDEAGAVALILGSEFAGVRLAAAEHVQSRPALEQVLQAMRNTDRRVAKLLQGRLDAIRYQLAAQQQAQAWIASGRSRRPTPRWPRNSTRCAPRWPRGWKRRSACSAPSSMRWRSCASCRPPACRRTSRAGAGTLASRARRVLGRARTRLAAASPAERLRAGAGAGRHRAGGACPTWRRVRRAPVRAGRLAGRRRRCVRCGTDATQLE